MVLTGKKISALKLVLIVNLSPFLILVFANVTNTPIIGLGLGMDESEHLLAKTS